MPNCKDNQELLHILNKIVEKAIDKESASDEILFKAKDLLASLSEGSRNESEVNVPSEGTEENFAGNEKSQDIDGDFLQENLDEKIHVVSDTRQTSSTELAKLVEKIKSSSCPESYLIADKELVRYVNEENSTRCVSTMAYEGNWNGETGWKSVKELEDMVSYLWHRMPSIFKPFDEERAISENISMWSKSYFEIQRNYLRHNFSIQRLCHMILVYANIYADQLNKNYSSSPKRRSSITVGTSKRPFEEDPKRNSPKSFWGRKSTTLGIIIVVAVLAVIAIFKLCSKSEPVTPPPVTTTSPVATQPITVAPTTQPVTPPIYSSDEHLISKKDDTKDVNYSGNTNLKHNLELSDNPSSQGETMPIGVKDKYKPNQRGK